MNICACKHTVMKQSHAYIHTQKYNPVAEKNIVMFGLIFQNVARIYVNVLYTECKT